MYQFTSEYKVLKNKVESHYQNKLAKEDFWSICSDYEQHQSFRGNIHREIANDNCRTPEVYRHDMAILHQDTIVETNMCWPILEPVLSGKVIDDVVSFPVYRTKIKNTEIEINPFPWQFCMVEFHPNADPIKGLLNEWFQRWYLPKNKPNPYLNVIHMLNGPFTGECGGEIYNIDFGTAPAIAFSDLLKHICRDGITRIEFK